MILLLKLPKFSSTNKEDIDGFLAKMCRHFANQPVGKQLTEA